MKLVILLKIHRTCMVASCTCSVMYMFACLYECTCSLYMKNTKNTMKTTTTPFLVVCRELYSSILVNLGRCLQLYGIKPD